MAIEFLQGLFGDGQSLTYEQLDQAITENGLNVADIGAGGYVAQTDHEELTRQLEEANGKLEGYDPDWSTKLEQAGVDADARVQNVIKDYAVRAAVSAADAIYPDVVTMLIDTKAVKIGEDGNSVEGIEEQLDKLREEKPNLFKDRGGKPHFGGPMNNQSQTGDAAQNTVDARYTNNPFYHKGGK